MPIKICYLDMNTKTSIWHKAENAWKKLVFSLFELIFTLDFDTQFWRLILTLDFYFFDLGLVHFIVLFH